MPDPAVRIIIEGDASQVIGQLGQLRTAFHQTREAAGGVAKQVRGDATGAIRAAAAAVSEARGLWGRFMALVQASTRVFLGLALYDVATRTLQAFKALAAAGVQMNAVIEQSSLAFTRSTGSAAAAFRHLRGLQMLAVRTAYDFGTLLESSKALQAWGYRAEDVVPIMEAVGNALAASGRFTQEYINRVILALGQIRQKGRLYGQELRQLAEAGIPMAAALTAAFGKPLDQLEKMRISADQAVDALIRYIQQSPKYANAIADQMRTLPGLLQRIRETGEIVLGYVASPFYLGLKGILARVADFLGRFAEQLLPADRIREGIRAGMGEFRRFAESAAGETRSLSQAFLNTFAPGPLRDAVAQWLEILTSLATVAYAVGRAVWDNIGGALALLRTLLAPVAQGFTDLAKGASDAAQSGLVVLGLGLEAIATRLLIVLPLQRLFEGGLRRLGLTAAGKGFFAALTGGLLGIAQALRTGVRETVAFTLSTGTSFQKLRARVVADLAVINAALAGNAAVARGWAARVATAANAAAAGIRTGVARTVVTIPTLFTLAGARAALSGALAALGRIAAGGASALLGIFRGLGVTGLRAVSAVGRSLLGMGRALVGGLRAIFGGIPGLLFTALVMFLPEILQNWRGFAESFIATGKAIWESIAALGKTLWYAFTFQWGKIDDVWRNVASAWSAAGQKWAPTLKATWESIKKGFTFELPEVDFEKSLQQMMEDIERGLARYMKTAGDAVTTTGELSEEAKRTAERISSAVTQIASSTSSAVGEILRSFGEGTQVATLRIRAALEGLREEILALPEGLGTRLADPITSVLQLIPQLAAGSKGALAALSTSTQEVLQRIAATLAVLGRAVPDEAREGLLAVKKAMLDLQVSIAEAFDAAYTKARDYALRMAEFLRRAGRISGLEFMQYIAAALAGTRAGTEAELEYRERLYEEALSLLDEELERVREVWDERIRMAEEAMEEEIRIREQALRALEEERTLLEREEAEREHAQKLADIEKELAYHRVRTGLEHQRKIEELLAQRAELEREWQQKQAEWQIEDRREQLQREIDDLREQGRKRIEELQRQRDETLKVFEDQYKKTIALAAAYSPEIRNTMSQPFQGFLEDLKTIFAEAEVLTGQAIERISRAFEQWFGPLRTRAEQVAGGVEVPDLRQVQVKPLFDYVIRDDTAWAWARDLGQLLNQPVEWDEANKQVIIGGKRFPTVIIDKRGFVPVRRVVEEFGGAVRWQGQGQPIEVITPRAHRGAKVLTGGIARLAPGELVFPPALASRLERLIAVLERWGGSAGTQVNLRGPLFSAERVAFDSRAEMELLARRLAKAVVALGAARG